MVIRLEKTLFQTTDIMFTFITEEPTRQPNVDCIRTFFAGNHHYLTIRQTATFSSY